MSKSDWKKLIESKIDDDWTDLDSSTPIEVFANKEKYTIELLVGDNEWDDCDELTPIENMNNFINFKNFKYRYKLKPLETIDVTFIEKLAGGNIECTKKDGSKFLLILDNGRD